uniref:Unclassified homeodomain containing protein n=1 Tax=Clytia hemisphaerica TaxID=252671 RepID=A0A069DMA2_9CNID
MPNMEKKSVERAIENSTMKPNTGSGGRHVKEKLVYKVVPVPYYYPVPVDAEWYYKHYDQPMRNGERGYLGFPDDGALEGFPFPPPPAYGLTPPRSALREPYYHLSREEEDRYVRPVSPLYRDSTRRHYSPTAEKKQAKENGDVESNAEETAVVEEKSENEERTNGEQGSDHVSPRSVKSEQSNDSEAEENQQNGIEAEEARLETSKSEGDEREPKDGVDLESGDEKVSHSDSEVARKRKRFPMTFPYDQRKKILNGHHSPHQQLSPNQHSPNQHSPNQYSPNRDVLNLSEETETEYKRSRHEEPRSGRVYSSHKYAGSNGTPVSNGHTRDYPYVMVPVRSPPYGDVGRPPRYSERSHSYYESRMYDDSYKESSGGRKDVDLADDKREIRYHPNGRRARTVFTRQQLLTLNNVFEKHPFVSGERMSELSDQLGLDRKIVKIWFQNKRQYARKKGSLVERGNEEFYYEYPERFNPTSAPPTMAEHWKAEN